jgi:hypothetical protein
MTTWAQFVAAVVGFGPTTMADHHACLDLRGQCALIDYWKIKLLG